MSCAHHEQIIETQRRQIDDLSEGYLNLVRLNSELAEALERSVKLQAHYAELLNMHDRGKRMIFKSAEEWLQRLRKVKKATELLVEKQREQAE